MRRALFLSVMACLALLVAAGLAGSLAESTPAAASAIVPSPIYSVAELGKSSIRYRIGIFGEGADSAAAEGEFVHVVVDRSSRRPIGIPADWRTKLEAIS